MTLEQALKTYLLADTAIVTLVGQRVYPDAIPQGVTTRPAIVYRQLGSDSKAYISGGEASVRRDTYELEARSTRRSESAAVRDRLRDMFAGTSCAGLWGGASGVYVAGAIFEEADADEEQLSDGSENLDRSLRATVTIIWNRG